MSFNAWLLNYQENNFIVEQTFLTLIIMVMFLKFEH